MKNHTIRNMFMLFGSILICMLMCTSCAFLNTLLQKPSTTEDTVNNTKNDDIELTMIDNPFKQRKTPQEAAMPLPQKTAYTGKTIAVPAPQFEKSTTADSWIPQFLQDSLTGQFAALSGMTVLDRKNESVVIAEQKLEESGYYSFDNAAAVGQLTNAEYVLTGSVQKLPSRYALTFRVNDIATNEIKASFNGQYTPADIENGKAVQDAVTDLFKGLDIPLTQQQIAGITKNRSAVTGTKKLAQGMAAEKSGDFVTALSFLSDSSESGNREAAAVISGMLSVATPANIREQANYYKEQTAKWNKIFLQLDNYMIEHYPIVVYDFSNMNHELNRSGSQVTLRYTKGVKIVPNRRSLILLNTIQNEWEKVKNNPAHSAWARNVDTGKGRINYSVRVGLYNKYGELLEEGVAGYGDRSFEGMRFKNQSVPPQFRLFDNYKFDDLTFWHIKINNKFIEPLSLRIISFIYDGGYNSFEGRRITKELPNAPIMSLSEWEQYLKEQE